MAYDFDQLNLKNQMLYQEKKQKFVEIEKDKYKLDTKIYQFKKRKNHFPKQN